MKNPKSVNDNTTKIEKSLDTAQQTEKNGSETVDKEGKNNVFEIENNNLKEIVKILQNFSDNQLESELSKLKKKPTITTAKKYLSKKYDFKYNEIANCFEGKLKKEKEFSEVNESDLFVELQENKVSLGQSSLKALLKSNFVQKYNVFQEYFENLPEWNAHDKDYILALADYTSVVSEDRKRFNYHFKKHIVRSVACALGLYANKQCLVFSGGQNNGKSTFIRFLLPKKLQGYIAENISTDKDSLIALTSNFIINLDELSTLTKSDTNALKSVFSKDLVKVRKPFEAKESLSKRVANFWGSTNKREFLSDETGSVRWLVFETKGAFNFKYTKDINLDMVYAQAYALLMQGFDYELSQKDVIENDKINKKYQIQTAEMESISYLYRPITKEDYDTNKDNNSEYLAKTATEIKQHLEDVYKQKFNTNNIGKALASYEFKQVSMRRGDKGIPIKVWLVKCINGYLEETKESTKNNNQVEMTEKGYPKNWD